MQLREKNVSMREPPNGVNIRKKKRRLKSGKHGSKAMKIRLPKRKQLFLAMTLIPVLARITLISLTVAGFVANARTITSKDVYAAIVATNPSKPRTLTGSPST